MRGASIVSPQQTIRSIGAVHGENLRHTYGATQAGEEHGDAERW